MDEEKKNDQERIADLQAQVATLQYKLHQLHATDLNLLRRGFVTVAQHVDALKQEATRLEALVDELEPELYPPEYIAEELGKAVAVTGAVYGIFTLVKTITPLPSKASSWLRRGLFAVTAIVISWRFATSSIGRFAASLWDHKRRRKAFLKELSELQQRIDILHALTSTTPGVQAALQASQQQQQQQAAGPPPPAAAAAAAAPAATSGAGGATPGEQFIVVDLPRVESGGFILPSPIGSPSPVQAAAAAGSTQQQLLPALGQGVPGSLAVTAARQQLPAATQHLLLQQQQQQQGGLQAGQVAAASSRADDARGAGVSAFTAPASVFGWGAVISQQERSAHLPQPDQPASAAAAAAAARAFSDTDAEEGEWVEQPGVTSADDENGSSGSSNGGSGSGRGRSAAARRQQSGASSAAAAAAGVELQHTSSPTLSSASDDVVLLERE